MSLRSGCPFFFNLLQQTPGLNLQSASSAASLHGGGSFPAGGSGHFSEAFLGEDAAVLYTDALGSRGDCAPHEGAVLSAPGAFLVFGLGTEDQPGSGRLLDLQAFGGQVVITEGWGHWAGVGLDGGCARGSHSVGIEIVGEGVCVVHVGILWQFLGEVVVIESPRSAV